MSDKSHPRLTLGRQQWAMGPAAMVGYKTPDYVFGVFPKYFWKLADQGDQKSTTRDASYMSLLYFGYINLPNAWQIGFSPSITYDRKATAGNKWNVPLGMGFSTTVRMEDMLPSSSSSRSSTRSSARTTSARRHSSS